MNKRLIIEGDFAYIETFERVDETGETGDNGWVWVRSHRVSLTPRMLTLPVSINCTFGQFWRWATADERIIALLQEIFSYNLGGFPLKAFIEQSRKHKPRPINDEMDALEVYWLEIHSLCPGFGGIGHRDGAKCNFAIEFTPLGELMDYPLVLNTKLEEHDENPPYGLLWSGTKEFTLYDILNGIFHEISFMGVPGDDTLDHGKKIMDEAKQALAKHKATSDS